VDSRFYLELYHKIVKVKTLEKFPLNSGRMGRLSLWNVAKIFYVAKTFSPKEKILQSSAPFRKGHSSHLNDLQPPVSCSRLRE
jgi:hypothetical protein